MLTNSIERIQTMTKTQKQNEREWTGICDECQTDIYRNEYIESTDEFGTKILCQSCADDKEIENN